MGISVNLISYKTEEIEKLISEYPQLNLREAFETCGKFLGEYYIILNNEYADGENPKWQLYNWVDELLLKSKGKKLKDDEDEDTEISDKIFELPSRDNQTIPSWIDRFEYIEYDDFYEKSIIADNAYNYVRFIWEK